MLLRATTAWLREHARLWRAGGWSCCAHTHGAFGRVVEWLPDLRAHAAGVRQSRCDTLSWQQQQRGKNNKVLLCRCVLTKCAHS